MPLFDFLCVECGATAEVLIGPSEAPPNCRVCGSSNVRKLLSAHSSLSGASKGRLPGAGDTACCGSSPSHAGCAGPGSCCGKNTY
ncbi:MAG: zinc ribbon domain-containing protein [Desulfobacteraceae bacterium]|nr:zinc ribbon domain-containing protein [Desulfobacteraceae bacterium]